MASAWLNSARLARKGHETRNAFNYVFHAIRLNPPLATVEHSKLLWQEGNHRKAILNLEGAIAKKLLLKPSDVPPPLNDSLVTSSGKFMAQSHMNAKAMLLHARWLDSAGQTQSEEMILKYLAARAAYQRWEQGHYYLGRYYNKLFEAEKALPSKRQGQKYLSGETAKLICQSYLRALAFGTKYIFQTLPRFLTLWLDLGELVSQNNQNMDESIGKEDFRHHMQKERVRNLKALHQTVSKYACDQLPAWMVRILY
jgi:serine/threonine-protein kinase ATR